MNDSNNDRREWVERMRTGAEITLAVSMALLGVLDALDRRQRFEDEDDGPMLLPAPRTRKEVDR
jgi:hypothetical protein